MNERKMSPAETADFVNKAKETLAVVQEQGSSRIVEAYDVGGLIVSTVANPQVRAFHAPYSTGIHSDLYQFEYSTISPGFAVVEEYQTEEEARVGHAKWVSM